MRNRGLIAAMTASIALTAWMGGTPAAVAAPSQHSKATSQSVDCSWLTEEGAVVFFNAQRFDEESGAFLFVESADYQVVLEGWGGSALFDSGTVTSSVDLTDVTTDPGTPAGTATVSVSRVPAGTPNVIVVDDRTGNEVTKGTETHQGYAVSDVEVSVPGHTIVPDPDACHSTDITFDVRTNSPAARIYTSTEFVSSPCKVDWISSTEVLLGGTLPEPAVQVVIFGEPVLKASGTVPLVAGAGSAILPLEDTTSGDPAGEVTVDVALKKRAGRERESFRAEGVTERIAVRTYEAHLTVTTPAGTGTAICVAWDVSSHTIIRPSVRGNSLSASERRSLTQSRRPG